MVEGGAPIAKASRPRPANPNPNPNPSPNPSPIAQASRPRLANPSPNPNQAGEHVSRVLARTYLGRPREVLAGGGLTIEPEPEAEP